MAAQQLFCYIRFSSPHVRSLIFPPAWRSITTNDEYICRPGNCVIFSAGHPHVPLSVFVPPHGENPLLQQ
ncbi:hypothetical protein RCIA145 [Methanocella arvoryzae MRE50]|uniref:Uncharacterized protein n=1 Tax=Methanocella arvoryzae (strain DSM 22066 / NBRC 105507 / MRE50) TaxID=351160 RepID=Q0W3I6_METAR|nr:hypothetical protein RCIA145 [Methanocella arvoryzae MRE50]